METLKLTVLFKLCWLASPQDHFHRMVQLTTEARKAYKDMITALEQEAEGGLRETQPSTLTTECEKNGLSETGKTSSKDSDEDVPNYSEYLLTLFCFSVHWKCSSVLQFSQKQTTHVSLVVSKGGDSAFLWFTATTILILKPEVSSCWEVL